MLMTCALCCIVFPPAQDTSGGRAIVAPSGRMWLLSPKNAGYCYWGLCASRHDTFSWLDSVSTVPLRLRPDVCAESLKFFISGTIGIYIFLLRT